MHFERLLLRNEKIDALREANEWTTASLSNLSFIAGRCICGLIITLAPRCPARGTSRDQRYPQRRSSCRCVVALRNVRTRRKKAERVGEPRWCDGDLFPRETQFHVSSASAINACGLISRGGARERKKINDATRADRVLEKELECVQCFRFKFTPSTDFTFNKILICLISMYR